MSTSDQGLLNMSTSLLVFELTNLMLLSNNLQACVVEAEDGIASLLQFVLAFS